MRERTLKVICVLSLVMGASGFWKMSTGDSNDGLVFLVFGMACFIAVLLADNSSPRSAPAVSRPLEGSLDETLAGRRAGYSPVPQSRFWHRNRAQAITTEGVVPSRVPLLQQLLTHANLFE